MDNPNIAVGYVLIVMLPNGGTEVMAPFASHEHAEQAAAVITGKFPDMAVTVSPASFNVDYTLRMIFAQGLGGCLDDDTTRH